MRVYSILDKRGGIYSMPFYALNDTIAVRRYIEVVSNSPWSNDFELQCIGNYDEISGLLDVGPPIILDVIDLTGGEFEFNALITNYKSYVPITEVNSIKNDISSFSKRLVELALIVRPISEYAIKKGWVKND